MHRDDRVKRNYNYFEHRAESALEARQTFIELVAERNKKDLAYISSSAMNIQQILQLYNHAPTSLMGLLQNEVKRNLMAKGAEHFIDNMSTSITPEVFFNFGNRYVGDHSNIALDSEYSKIIAHHKAIEALNKSRQVITDQHDELRTKYHEKENFLAEEKKDESKSHRIEVSNYRKKQIAEDSQAGITDTLVNQSAPRLHPGSSAEKRKEAENAAPSYTTKRIYTVSYVSRDETSQSVKMEEFHTTRRADAIYDDNMAVESESWRLKADMENLRNRGVSQTADDYFRQRWVSGHNEALVPINISEEVARHAAAPITDRGGSVEPISTANKIAKTIAPQIVKDNKQKT